jgi:tRNA threonylcarbamoyladenosine biosynthesis protein TsaE
MEQFQTESNSAQETETVAEQIGKNCQGSEVIELMSDLGGGKTTFVRGLVRGIGSKDTVSSPTFTISKVYKAEKIEVQHFDFYRLSEPGLVAHELEDIISEPGIITIIEWAEVVQRVLPETRLRIEFTRTSETGRNLIFKYPTSMSYLLRGIS